MKTVPNPVRPAELDVIRRRIAALGPVEVDTDGRKWWDSQQVCRALHLNPDQALKRVRREYKRRTYIYAPGFQSQIRGRLSLEGVKTLIMEKPGLPVAEITSLLTNGRTMYS